MISIKGYTITHDLYEGTNSIVYRGTRDTDNQAVVLKLLNREYPTPQEIARFKREYEIIRSLNLENIIEIYGLEAYKNSLLMILEDFGGKSLAHTLLTRKLSLAEFLTLAMRITATIGEIHQQNIIHKDINPSNILWNPQKDLLKLIDFGIAAKCSYNQPETQHPSVFEGTPAYMSPEQTGRMNRRIDYRTDFYSLGVSLYEMLLGFLPFQTTDTIELVHCHLAKTPKAPHQINQNIPKPISDIVMKLLSKTAADRYQSASGLLSDLQKCLEQLQFSGHVHYVAIGQDDVSKTFQIPQKLYGREKESKALLAAFDRVCRGKSELILISGYSGIGKSTLVHEIHTLILEKHGYFTSGKFGHFRDKAPYSAVIQALNALIEQLLTEKESQLALWKELVLSAIGSYTQILLESLPKLQFILGKPAERSSPSSIESPKHLASAFRELIRSFSSPEHPLVIFLDNLQWADSASLKLLQSLLSFPDNQGLLIIGAYREQEVTAKHPLTAILDDVRQDKISGRQIVLAPLAIDDICQLLAESLHDDKEELLPLAKIVLEKTGGNPFAVKEFLTSMETEEVLMFDPRFGRWRWNLDQIQGMTMTENVVEFMVAKIRKLPAATQQTLQFAACIGNRFDLHSLAVIMEKTETEIATEIDSAMNAGIILPADESYRYIKFFHPSELKEFAPFVLYDFVHNRFQEAALELISEKERGNFHLKIGRYMLHGKSQERALEEKLPEIVNHFNIGASFINSEPEKVKLVRLNLLAGRQAKISNDYPSALQYLKNAITLLGKQGWQEQYALTLDVYKEQAEAEYLSGHFEQAETSLFHLLECTNIDVDKATVYNLLIIQYTLKTQYDEAVQVGRNALRLLGVRLPENDLSARLKHELVEIDRLLHTKTFEILQHEPHMLDPTQKAVIQLLDSLIIPTLQTDYSLYLVIIGEIIKRSLTYGHAPESAFGYSRYGALLGSLKGEYALGYEFGLFAVTLSEQFQSAAQRCKTMFSLSADLACWMKPIKHIHSIEHEAYHTALNAGDPQFAGMVLAHRIINLLYEGTNLGQILNDIPEFLDFVKPTYNQAAMDMILGCQLIIQNLSGLTSDKLSFDSENFSEARFFENCQNHHSTTALCVYLMLKSQVLYLYGEREDAWQWFQKAEKQIDTVSSFLLRAEYTLYHSLMLTSRYSTASEEQQTQYWQRLVHNQYHMNIWAESCPENFRHCYLLVQAEIARLSNKLFLAMQLYQQAIETAKEQNFIHHEALAHEVAARFYRENGFHEFAEIHIRKAHYGYNLWGAAHKTAELCETYPQLLKNVSARSERMATTGSSTSVVMNMAQNGLNMLDLSTVMKASQAISEKIVLTDLLEQMMKIVIENAGAQKGWLLRHKKEQWVIDAESSIDSGEVKVLQSIPVGFAGAMQTTPLPASLIQYVLRTQESVILNDASQEGDFTHDPHIIEQHVKSVLCTPLMKRGQITGVIYLENNLTTGSFTPDRLNVLKVLSAQMVISIENATLYKQLNESLEHQIELSNKQVELTTAFSRFVPKEFLSLLEKKSIVDVQLGDQIEKEITVMFSDIRGFTPLSEQMSPQENFNFINSYLRQMNPAIREYNGFIDKYIGDAIMALFPTNADDAVQCSIAMLKKLKDYNKGRKRAGYKPIRIGIGLNTGLLMLGTVGDQERMDGTVISDAVNLAARIEGMTKTYGVSLLISETTYFQLNNLSDYHIRIIDQVQAKGKSEPVTVFEVFNADPPHLIESKLKTLVLFKQGFKLYHQTKFSEAQALFNDVLEADPEDKKKKIAEAKELFLEVLHVNPYDKVAQMYVTRCEQIETYGIPEEWLGVWAWVDALKR